MSKIAIKYEPFRTFEHPKQQLESAIGLKTRNTHDYNTVENNYYSINTVLLNSNNKKQLRTTSTRAATGRTKMKHGSRTHAVVVVVDYNAFVVIRCYYRAVFPNVPNTVVII